MWTYLANWLVQDGEIPELHAGAVLHNVALRAASWRLQDADGAEGVKEHHDMHQDSQMGTHYDLTGTVEAACEPGSVVLRVGTFRVLAEPNGFREVGDDGALKRYSADFPIPTVGTRATVSCTLEVMAAYETEDEFLGVSQRPAYPVTGSSSASDWHVGRSRLHPAALATTP